MKKAIQRMTAVILCLFTVFSMAGCTKGKSGEILSDDSGILFGFDEEQGQGIQSNDAAASGTDSATSNMDPNQGVTVTEQIHMSADDPFKDIPKNLKGTTVVFAQFGDEGASEYQKVCSAFTKKTGIKVKILSYDQDTYTATVSKQIAAHSSPDVVICNEIFPQGLEIAQPIQNLLDLNEDFWDDSVTAVSTIGGNTYFVNSLKGVWHNIDMVFYNKKIFSENGITSPADYYKKGEWTYENMRKCLEDVKKTGNVGGYVDPKMMAASMGVPLISYDPATCTFSQHLNDAVSAYQFTGENAKNGLWDPNLWFGIFSNGSMGLYVNSAYGCKFNGWFKDADASTIGAVPTPKSYNGIPCKQTESMRAYGLAKGAKNPEGAAYFLRYYLDYSYYESAGAEVFRNAELKKAYFDSLDVAASEGINYYFNRGAYYYTSVTYKDLVNIGNANPAQVQSLMLAYTNQFDDAVNKLNAKINELR